MDHKPSQVDARHFELAMFRQQETTAKSTDWGKTTPFKQTSRETRIQQQQHEPPPTRRLRSAGISEGRRRPMKTSNSIPAETGKLFISAKRLCCILYALLCVFFCFAFLAISLVTISGTEGNKNYPLKMGAIGTRTPKEQLLSWP